MTLSLNHMATACISTCAYSFPNVVEKIERMVMDSDCTSQLICSIILSDPMLSALVLSRANATEPDTYLHTNKAISVLGLSSIFGFCDECLRISRSKQRKMASLWAAANACASMCCIVAKQSRIDNNEMQDKEICHTVGLLHDIGSIVGLGNFDTYFDEAHKKSAYNGQTVHSQLKQDLGLRPSDLGALLAKTWHLPRLYADAIRYHRRPLDCQVHVEFACLAHISHLLCRALGYRPSCESFVEAINPEALEVLGIKERQLKICIDEFIVEDEELSLYEGFFAD